MPILRFVLLTFAFLFILLLRIDLRITKRNNFTIKINFIFFAIILEEDKIKRIRMRDLQKLTKNLSGLIKSTSFLISKSNITVSNKYNTPFVSENPITIFTRRTSTALILTYLANKAKSFAYDTHNSIESSYFDPTILDLTFHFSLLNLIISALILLYYIIKNKVKRVLKNV